MKNILFLIFFFQLSSFELKSLRPLFNKKGKIILDCGAHTGATSIELARQFPKATIIAVEADPDIFKLLKRYTAKYKNIKSFHLALGGYNGIAKFYQNKNKKIYSQQGSLYKPSQNHWYWPTIELDNNPIKIPIQTLDFFCAKNKIKHVDFIHSDIQGAEYEMLKNGKKILSKVKAIYLEVHFEKVYENIVLYDSIKIFLESKGFIEKEIIPLEKSYADAFFIKK